MSSEEAMNAALNALADLQEKMNNQSSHSENISKSIESLQKDLKDSEKKAKGNAYISGANGVVQVAQSVVNNLDKFTSGDALGISSGALAIIGTIGGVVGGPAGPLIAGVCGLVASILPLFGGSSGSSMGEVLEKVIKEALSDFKDEEIYGQVLGSLRLMKPQMVELNGIAEKNGGLLKESEKSFLTTLDFSTAGVEILGALQAQLDRHKDTTNETEATRLATYCYYYSMISTQKRLILTLQCALLRRNDMEAIYHGVRSYLDNALLEEDKKTFKFLIDLPNNGKWWLLYRYIHTELEAPQRSIISNFLKVIGCEIKGQLCFLYNEYMEQYMFTPTNGSAEFAWDKLRRNIFTAPEERSSFSCKLYRLIGPRDNCQILSVHYSEYLYAPDYATMDSQRRRVFSWRSGENPGSQGYWEVTNDRIRNIDHNEYMYSTDHKADNYAHVLTWRPGTADNDAVWRIMPVSFEKSPLNYTAKQIADAGGLAKAFHL
ncbi:toxin CfTX-A-like [Clytia hemisphaerica]|uniref:Uncharacterized protein n=1 Tax=Clytia hemisphaerica TaxID=252671 RepID=A0A7M5XIS0_9CNID